MQIIAKVGAAIQRLFGKTAEEAAQRSGLIQRKRKFTAVSLAQTFVLGFLKNPHASDEELAQMAVQCGAEVTPQAVEQRHTPRLLAFLKELFQQGAKIIVGTDRVLAPILERFSSVTLIDGSVCMLPSSMKDQYPGCGGSKGSGAAALRLQTELDLRTGNLTVELEAGRSPDQATSRQHVRRGPGSLRIGDQAYFSVPVFAEMMAAGEHFLSRLPFGIKAWPCASPEETDLRAWLEKQRGPFVDQPIFLGQKDQLRCRLIAWRLPQEQANRRRQKLRQEAQRNGRCEPSAARLAWCDWTILVTSVPPEMLTPPEAVVLYRSRWQVELLFKRWKSQDRIAVLSGSTEVRQMVRVWSRLLMALVQHWLLVASAWGDPTKSLSKASEAIRDFASRLATSLGNPLDVERVIADIGKVIAKTCQRNKRSKPGTFELLNDIERLDFC